jgi:hypothetical protein
MSDIATCDLFIFVLIPFAINYESIVNTSPTQTYIQEVALDFPQPA